MNEPVTLTPKKSPTPKESSTPRESSTPEESSSKSPWRLDLLKVVPGLRWLVTRRWFQFAVILPNLAFFYFFIIAGISGSPVGNRNIIIIFVWIFWWFMLITFMVPLASRVWCTVCPFPFLGEWIQRLAFIKVRVGKPGVGRNRMFGLNRKWPRALSNIWLQNIGFLCLATFSALLVTRAIFSVFVLGGLVVIAIVIHMIFRQRAFCNYVCPVSGFLSLYSMTSMVEVRSKNRNVCKKCKDKGCLLGNENGWGCPWSQYPSTMDRNNYCGLCMECIKTCPYKNMTVQARPFCSDTKIKSYDESWKAFIMLTLAMLYSVTLLGPWGLVKDWANISEVGNLKGFLTYAGIIWFAALVAVPALWALASWAGKRFSGTNEVSTKEIFLRYSYVLVPLGLLAWIAFSFPLVMVNGSYIVSVASDPMGAGWNIFRTANIAWTPVFPEYVIHIQIIVLLMGLGFALWSGYKIARSLYSDTMQGVRSLIPAGVFCTGITIVFLRLFTG